MQRSVRDIRQSLGVPDVLDFRGAGERAAPATARTALDEALEYRSKVLAQSIVGATGRQVEAETEAEATEAELKKTKAEVELLELRGRMEKLRQDLSSMGPAGAGIDNALGQIVALMREDKQQALIQIEELRNQLMQGFQSQISDLRDQLFTRGTEPSTNGQRAPSAMDEIQQAKSLLEVVKDLFPSPAGADLRTVARDIDDLVKLHRLEEDHEARMMRLRMEGRRLDADLDEKAERLREDKRRGESLTDAISRALPFAERLASDVGGRMFGARGSPPSEGLAAPAPPYGPGVRVAPCSQCKSLIPFAPNEDTANCPNCNLPHLLQMEEEAPVSPPPAEPPAQPPVGAKQREEAAEREETPLHAV